MIPSHEFNVSMKDLAINEVHIDFLIRETRNAVDRAMEEFAKMDIELDSIKQPNLKAVAKVEEFAEKQALEFGRIKEAIEAKKAEILKTEQDYSSYDAAMAEAKALSEKNMKAISLQAKKKNPLA